MFCGVGTVTEAVVHTQDGSPKARATVTFADSSQAERAVSTMHGKLIEGIGNIGVKMLAPVKEGVRSSPPPPKVEAGAGGSQGGSDGAAKAKPKSTIWSSGLGRSQVSSRMEEEARRREWEATKGIVAVAGVRRRAGIVPKRPQRERKAPNPNVPVDFRPEPKCHNHQVEREDWRGFDCQAQSSQGKKKRKFEGKMRRRRVGVRFPA